MCFTVSSMDGWLLDRKGEPCVLYTATGVVTPDLMRCLDSFLPRSDSVTQVLHQVTPE